MFLERCDFLFDKCPSKEKRMYFTLQTYTTRLSAFVVVADVSYFDSNRSMQLLITEQNETNQIRMNTKLL